MKKQFIKQALTFFTLSASVGYAGLSNAHIYSGFMPNKTTQVLTLECPATTVRVFAEVLDLTANNGIMSVTIFKDGNSQTASDLVQGNGVFGPDAVLAGGSGNYYLIASHTAIASGIYKIQYHCENAGGGETTGAPATLTQP